MSRGDNTCQCCCSDWLAALDRLCRAVAAVFDYFRAYLAGLFVAVVSWSTAGYAFVDQNYVEVLGLSKLESWIAKPG